MNRRSSQSTSSSANNCGDKRDEPANKKSRTESDNSVSNAIDSNKPKMTKEEEYQFYIDKACKAFDNGCTSRSLESQNMKILNSAKNKRSSAHNNEVFDAFKKWTTATKMDNLSYFPQVGDEVVYLRPGHLHYTREMRKKELIRSTRNNSISHHYSIEKYKNKDYVFAIVRDMSFESKPILSIKLNLEEVDPETERPNNTIFAIQYLKMGDIPDFIILRQTYNNSLDIRWKAGDTFKSSIMEGSHWMRGAIIKETEFLEEFPNSSFKRFEINRADQSYDRLSPWDLTPLDNLDNDKNGDHFVNGFYEISKEERLGFYQSKSDDWPCCSSPDEGGISGSIKRNIICTDLKKVIMKKKECIIFTNASLLYTDPKPLYLIDMKTIRDRLKFQFYRRSAQIEFDLKALQNNVKSAKTNAKTDPVHLQNLEKFLKALFAYMEIDFWEREFHLFEQMLKENSFTDLVCEQESMDDSDIQEIIVINCNNSQNQQNHSERVSVVPTPSLQSTSVVPIESKPIKQEVIEPLLSKVKTEPREPEDSKAGILQTVSTIATQTEILPSTHQYTQIESTHICQIETQTEALSIRDENTQTVCETSHREIQTQTESTQSSTNTDINCQKPSENESQTQIHCRNDLIEPVPIEPENKSYLCVFCKTNTYFLERNQALAHYKSHLDCEIQCDICYNHYDSVEEFREQDSEHSDCTENVTQIKQFYLTLDWIESFLDFQMTRLFNRLVRIIPELCPVCNAIKQMSAQTFIPLNAIEDEDSFEEHIYHHFKHNDVYECIKCSEQSGGLNFKFFFDVNEAQNHLRTHELNIDLNKMEIYFRINDTLNKKLSGTIQKYIESNKTIEEIYKSNCIDA